MRIGLWVGAVLAAACSPDPSEGPGGAMSVVVAEGDSRIAHVARRADGTLVVVASMGEGWRPSDDRAGRPGGDVAFFVSATGEVERVVRLAASGWGTIVPLPDGFALFATEGTTVDPDGEALGFPDEPGDRLLLVRLEDDGAIRWATVLEGVTHSLPFATSEGVAAFADGDGVAWASVQAIGEVRIGGQVVAEAPAVHDPQALFLRLDASTGALLGTLLAEGEVGSGVHTLLPDGDGVIACGMLAGYGFERHVTFGDGADAVTMPFSSDDDPATTPFLLGLRADLSVRYGLAVEALGPSGLCAASARGVDLLVSPPYYGSVGLGDTRIDAPVGLVARLEGPGRVTSATVVAGAEATYRASPEAVGPRGDGVRGVLGVVGGSVECGTGGVVAPDSPHAWAAPDDRGGFPCAAHLVTVDLDAGGAVVGAQHRFTVPDGNLWVTRSVVTPGGVCIALGSGGVLGAPGAAPLSDPSPGVRVVCDVDAP